MFITILKSRPPLVPVTGAEIGTIRTLVGCTICDCEAQKKNAPLFTTYTHTHIHTHTYTHTHTYIYTFRPIYVYIYILGNMPSQGQMPGCTAIYIYIHMCVCCVCVCVFVCVCVGNMPSQGQMPGCKTPSTVSNGKDVSVFLSVCLCACLCAFGWVICAYTVSP